MDDHLHEPTTQALPGGAHGLLGLLRRWWRERRTAAALHGLDDAGLKDLGLGRSQIASIAHRHSTP